jgi:hypothetical protein
MGYRRRVSRALHVYGSGNRFYAGFPVKVPGFDTKSMGGKFPDVKTDPDHHRKLGMDTGKTPGNDRIKGSYDGKFAAAFLGKITKGKEFCFQFCISPGTS